MRYAIFILIHLIINSLYAQDLPLFSQYTINPFLINPARAGSTQCSEIILTHRSQWLGMEDAPSTQILTFQTRANKNIAWGICLANDQNGLTKQMIYQATFAYHLNFSKIFLQHDLSFGISFQTTDIQIDEAKFTQGIFDPKVNGTNERILEPNANFGIFYMRNKFYGGISLANLLQISNSENYSRAKPLTSFLQAGYYFPLNQDLTLTPTLVYKVNKNLSQQMDFNLKAFYFHSSLKNFWLSVSYRSDLNLEFNTLNFQAAIGMKLKNLYFAYIYDNQMNSISTQTFASHEFMIGMKICSSKSAVPCPAYKQR